MIALPKTTATVLRAGIIFGLFALGSFVVAADDPSDRKTEYVKAVGLGAGYMPWQKRGISDEERQFREAIESRKDDLLNNRVPVQRPVLLTVEEIAQAQKNIKTTEWGRKWFASQKQTADYVIAQPDEYVEQMLSELTPMYVYGFTCPHCVGKKSQEATGSGIVRWNFREPDKIICAKCEQTYPHVDYPETEQLVCPRSEQTFHYYINEDERKHPEDRSGRHAWHWVGYPIHVSFSGMIRDRKVGFMMTAVNRLATTYALTKDPRYARRAIQILVRLAHCYRNWLYHDYWDTVADCDPMYAAYHDKSLILEWKRHACGNAYRRDSTVSAAMLQDYWGAGRIHPSTDTIGQVVHFTRAYDLLYTAKDADDNSLWQPGEREKVERDLILEQIMGAEPYVSGPGKATCANNKAPRVYRAMAAVARGLGIAEMADTAIRGFSAVRDHSFIFDGFSTESPSYTNMYLSQLVYIPERLHGFEWPANFQGRQGVVNLYESDDQLRRMYTILLDQLQPNGEYLPLSDSKSGSRPSAHLLEIGLNRYPELFRGRVPTINRRRPSEYAVFHLDSSALAEDRGFDPPESYFPAWMTAVLRHGQAKQASTLAIALSPKGGHRHRDNLSLFYAVRDQPVLGDFGYVGDMPINRWLRSTQSHNLVVVDGAEQAFDGRHPQLHRMVSSDFASVVEASSDAYKNCSDYRRLVAMIKGPNGKSFAIDLFRVKGGQQHEYRLFSEIASSDAEDGQLSFAQFDMPAEAPLPEVGSSLAASDIYGLRDIRHNENPPNAWQATWSEPDNQFRVWLLSPSDRVEAANGPGQETRRDAGRRVRYLNVVRQGTDLQSTFVAVHEPATLEGRLPISRVERLPVATEAGADAVALRIETEWGSYLVLSGFQQEATVAGVRFQGEFGLLHEAPSGKRQLLASEAVTMQTESGFGFEQATAVWSGTMASREAQHFVADQEPPTGFNATTTGVTNYVLAPAGAYRTGWPIASIDGAKVQVARFPLQDRGEFRIPNVWSLTEQP